MLCDPKDLDALSGSGGELFERCICDLVLVECRYHGINRAVVDWDYRTNVPDGGMDIFIRVAHNDPNPRFIPNKPSIWSLKAGTNGVQVETLRAEIEASAHSRLRSHLKDGHVYVWCALQPIDQEKRAKMRDEAVRLARKLGFSAEQIVFRWRESLTGIFNAHPNIILQHLSDARGRLGGVITLDQWRRESPDKKGLGVPWVDFGGRSHLKDEVRNHLLGTDEPAVFHIAGLSGIGKTRTAIQACLDSPGLEDTLYAPSYAGVSDKFFRWLDDPEAERHVRLIVDEVPLKDYRTLADRFREVARRIRIVTIGPAKRDEHRRTDAPELVVLDEPDTEDGVLQVSRRAGPGVDDEVLKSIAEASGHDLRLALMLVRATKVDPELRSVPVRNCEDVWDRVTSLFAQEIGDVVAFSEAYELLTVAIDIGRAEKHRSELEYVARHFEKPVTELDSAIDRADRCGLGVRTPYFFEAAPRALAVWVFADRLWRMLEPGLDRFLGGVPTERFLRRIVERCQEVQGPRRKEVMDQIGRFFHGALGSPAISQLSDPEKSRVFQAWAELDPHLGLAWLTQAVNAATKDELESFEGVTQIFGVTKGRRYLVWLCEHLACFGEHFGVCEQILFRLALHETETSIANNSTNAWKEMFWPVLSGTEVPFWERWKHLMQRLNEATQDSLTLIMDAALAAIAERLARQAPPAVVGGRVVPVEWRPVTLKELQDLRREAGASLLRSVTQLKPELRRSAVEMVLGRLAKFAYLGLVRELRETLAAYQEDPEITRAVRAALDEVVSWEESRSEEEPEKRRHPEPVRALKNWLDELAPKTLKERVLDVTGRDYWSFMRRATSRAEDAAAVYEELAKSVLRQPGLICDLASWFESNACRSGERLAFFLGKNDSDYCLRDTILQWLRAGQAQDFVVQYLCGVSVEARKLPPHMTATVDQVVQSWPLAALRATLAADVSDAGFERLIRCLDRISPADLRLLGSLTHGRWEDVLDADKRAALADRLLGLAQGGQSEALAITVGLMGDWARRDDDGLDSALADRALKALRLAILPEHAVDDYEWKVLMEAVLPRFPQQAAEILAITIADVKSHRFARKEYTEELFAELAKSHPDEAMAALGPKVMDERGGVIFRMFGFKGLFDAIGLDTVRPWIERNGPTAAVRVARHLNGPSVDSNGNPTLPELADWLLSKYGDVRELWSEFCMGRHSGEVQWGHARDRREDVEQLVTPFKDHPREWVRRWVQYELANLEREIEWDERHEDEMLRG